MDDTFNVNQSDDLTEHEPYQPVASIFASRFSNGALVGVALMLALLAADYVAEAAWHVPFVPRVIGQWLHSTFPMGTGAWAVLCVLIGAGIGALYEYVRPATPTQGMIGGLLIGGFAFVVSLLPTLAVAQNSVSGISPVGIIGWLLLCALWGVAVDQTGRGAAARPINPMDTDSPVISRRMFLLQTISGALLVVVLSFPMARLIDGKQLLPNLPFPPSQGTPIPPENYF